MFRTVFLIISTLFTVYVQGQSVTAEDLDKIIHDTTGVERLHYIFRNEFFKIANANTNGAIGNYLGISTKDNNLSFEWQSADWPMHASLEDDDKTIHDVELVMKAAAASSVTVSWYVDGATSATATGTSAPGSTVNEYVHYVNRLCKRIRVGVANSTSNGNSTYDDGRLRISQALFQYTVQRALARRLI